MRPKEIAIALETLIKANRPAFIEGSPGVGKSQVVTQVADKLGMDLIDVRAAQFDPVDLRGLPYLNGDNRTHWSAPDFLPTEGKGILFLDELNAADRSVQAACYQLVLDRRLGDYRLPDGWVIVAAGNKESDRAVTNRMSTALASRFVHLAYETHLDDWCAWAVDNDMPPQLIAFLRFRPNLLHAFDPKSSEKAFPCPRTWQFVGDIIKAGAPPAIEHELFKGTVGEGAAVELSGFLRIWRKLPSLDGILTNPQTAAVPEDPATLFAVAGGLARRASDKNFDRVMTYANRIPKEWQTYLVKDAVRRDSSLDQTAAFIKWASVNAEVLG
jgi:hypothetical protein